MIHFVIQNPGLR